MRIGKYRNFRAFLAFHPRLESFLYRVRKVVLRLALALLALIVLQWVVVWLQIQPLKKEFAAGAEQVTCTRISWEEGLDCGGYYDEIVNRRNQILEEAGCVIGPAWTLDTGKPETTSLWISGPICWKPFPLGSVF